jgi:hypothetical protein
MRDSLVVSAAPLLRSENRSRLTSLPLARPPHGRSCCGAAFAMSVRGHRAERVPLSWRPITRWMPTCPDPEPPRFHHPWTVHLQPRHRDAPHGRQAEDARSLVAPADMLVPPVEPWVEEATLRACLRISAALEGQLEPVAAHAGQAQVAFLGRATRRLGDDVVDLHLHDDRLPGQAVLTAPLRPFAHRLAERWRDIGHLGPALQLLPDVVPALLQHEQRVRAQERHAIRLIDQRSELRLLLRR